MGAASRGDRAGSPTAMAAPAAAADSGARVQGHHCDLGGVWVPARSSPVQSSPREWLAARAESSRSRTCPPTSTPSAGTTSSSPATASTSSARTWTSRSPSTRAAACPLSRSSQPGIRRRHRAVRRRDRPVRTIAWCPASTWPSGPCRAQPPPCRAHDVGETSCPVAGRNKHATQTQPAAVQDATSGWWPSKYGADDQAGALNEITPGKTWKRSAWCAGGGWRLCQHRHGPHPFSPACTARNWHKVSRLPSSATPTLPSMGLAVEGSGRIAELVQRRLNTLAAPGHQAGPEAILLRHPYRGTVPAFRGRITPHREPRPPLFIRSTSWPLSSQPAPHPPCPPHLPGSG